MARIGNWLHSIYRTYDTNYEYACDARVCMCVCGKGARTKENEKKMTS